MKSILIVEDEISLRMLFTDMLVEYAVLQASNDKEAFDQFERHNPEVVLMDLNLGPNSLPGNEICRQFKKLSPATQVICVSGNFEMFEPNYGFKNGFCAVIAKPVRAKELRRVVKEAFDEFEKATE